MKTPLPPESLESRIAPAAVSGLGDELVGPAPLPFADSQTVEAAPPQIMEPTERVLIPRSGNFDLAAAVPDITTVPVHQPTGLTELSAAAAEAVQTAALNLSSLATSALGGEPTGIGTLGVGDGEGASAGIDTTSALQSGAANIADLVLVKSGGFAGANPESLLIVKV